MAFANSSRDASFIAFTDLKYCNKDTSVFSPIPLISLNTLIVCFFSRN